MKPNVAFADGAELNALATWVVGLLEDTLARHPSASRDFLALRSAVAMVAPDRPLSVTLRFDLGQLTVHDGMVGIPDVTFCADYEVLVGIADMPLSRPGRLPVPIRSLGSGGGGSWRRILTELVGGELKIYGLVAHPRTVLRVLRLLSRAQ